MKKITILVKSITIFYLFFTFDGFAQTQRPDFSGIWMPVRELTKGFPRSDWNFTKLGEARWESYASEFDPDKDDPAHFCMEPGIVSMAGGAPFPLEIIHRDQDITLFFEAYAQYRKIWMDDYDRPEPVLPSRMGYSVASWQDDILVVKTHMLAERTLGRVQLSGNATVEEKWQLDENEDGQRILLVDINLSDPEIYKEDIKFRGAWIDTPGAAMMEYVCSSELYEKHLERVRRGNRD